MDKWVKGEHYDRLLKEFLDKGGDLSLCPFDTDDYKYEAPPYLKRGSDSDHDPVLDEVWEDIQKNGLKGATPTEEEWAEWEREYHEIAKRNK